MSEPAVHRRPLAERDLYEIASYIAADNPDAADRFLDAAERTWKRLAAMPGMGRRRRFENPALREVRSWRVEGFERYLIFYQPLDPSGIEVIRVLCGVRDIEAVFGE